MKNLLLLLLFLPLSTVYGQESAIKNGTYTNRSEMVYEIVITGEDITFYLKENERDEPGEHKLVSKGKIVTQKNKYFVENVTGDKVSNRKKEPLEIKVKDGALVFKSYNLFNAFYDTVVIYSNKVEFQPQPN
jgi:hypothetical protein